MTSKFSLDFSKLLGQIDSVAKKTYTDDVALWKPTKDSAGNATALIRFLPSKNIEDFPFARLYSHSFQDPTTKRWYFENSLTTIGQQDLISDVNKELWNSGIEENKKIAQLRKRKLSYIVNIYVIKDVGNPDNDGKVFKYKFGPKIWDKIVNASKGDEALGEEPILAFCPINGADFLLKMQKANDQFNYDASKFNAKKPFMGGDDKKIEEILNQCYDIQLEVAPDKFKSPEELAKKFLWAIGQEKQTAAKDADVDAEMDMLSKLAEASMKKDAVAPKAKNEQAKVETKKTPPMPVMEPSTDPDEAFFKSLLSD